MANPSFVVACPTCDADVPIKSMSLVGGKIDCPKCKFRFVVPPPPSEGGDDDMIDLTAAAPEKAVKAAKGGKGAKAAALDLDEFGAPKPKKPANTKLLVGSGVGVLALLALGVAGFMLFGEDEKKPAPVPPRAVAQANPLPAAPVAPAPDETADKKPDPAKPADAEGAKTPDKPPEKPEGAAEPPATPPNESTAVPGTEAPATKPTAAPADAVPLPPNPMREVSNLLPGDSTGVYRVNFDPAQRKATPLFNAFFDNKIRNLFNQSMTFGVDQMETSVHCVVGPERDPFVVLRTKAPIRERKILEEWKLSKEPLAVNGKAYYLVESNPFIDALGKTFGTTELFKLVGIDITNTSPRGLKEAEEAAKRKYAVHVYDSQTVMVGTQSIVERFLNDLEPSGYPPYKSELTDPNAAPPAEAPGAAPPGGKRPGSSDSSAPLAQQGRPRPGAEGPGAESPGTPGAPPGGQPGIGIQSVQMKPRKLYTTIPTYRTIDPNLKRVLNAIEEDLKTPAPVVFCEQLPQNVFNPQMLNAVYRQTGNALFAALARIKLAGGHLDNWSRDTAAGSFVLEFLTDDDAVKTVKEFVGPAAQTFAQIMDQAMGTQTRVGGLGALQDNNNNGGQFGGGGALGGGDEGGGPPRGGPPRGGPPRGGPPPGAGPPGGFPGGPPGAGGPGGDPNGPGLRAANQGDINLIIQDRVLTVPFLFNWPEERYNAVLQPAIARGANQFKGRMSVLTGELEVHRLASTATKLKAAPKPFPKGTQDYDTAEVRYRLAHPPESRASFFLQLLPYVGQRQLLTQYNDKKYPWYAKENAAVAESWVPEFVSPDYPQAAWRARHPLAQGRSLGGTNFVALAGLGLDAGRYDPANAEAAKKVGVIGYEWGSKFEEITDGLSNTIFLAQVAPGNTGRPWIAGGGATVVGVDEGANPMAPFAHTRLDKSRATVVLMADGSVRTIREGADPKLFRALVTRAGGESFDDLDKFANRLAPTKPTESILEAGGAFAGVAEGAIDADELKKLQGTWVSTYIKSEEFFKGIEPGNRDKLKVELTFEGNVIYGKLVVLGKSVKAPGADTIVRLDPKTKPASLDTRDSKGVLELGVYELSGTRLKVRSTKGDKRPERVAIPDDKSGDQYVELEKLGK